MQSIAVRLTIALVAAALAGCVVDTSIPKPDGSVMMPDGAAPSLVALVPSKGATNVRLDTSLVLQFSSAVVPTSLVVNTMPSLPLGTAVFNVENTEARFGPLSLVANTQYTVTIAAADAEGRAVTGELMSSFTTVAQVDTMAPTLVSSTPAAAAMNVPLASAVSLTFSEAMEPGSLVVSLEPAKPLADATWSAGDTVATFAAPGLDGKTDYVLQYSATDKAGNPVSGNLSFSTATPPDTDAPTVLSNAPAANAMAVPTNAVLSISFSEAMNKATVDSAFSISPAVAGTALWDGTDTLRTFQPSAPLAPSTQYTVTVGVGARDRGGNALAAPFSFTFTTAAAPDTTRPTVVSTTPDNGAMGVSTSSKIAITFSEPMDKASVQVAFVVNVPMELNGGSFVWSADGRTVTYSPPGFFQHGQNVAFRIGAASRDLAGNTLMANVDRGFAVRKFGIAVLDSVMAIDGHVTNAGTVSTGASTLIVGDTGSNVALRSFVSFDLSSIPASTLAITSADLVMYLSGVAGNPQSTLGGNVRLERVAVGPALAASAYGATRLDGVLDEVSYGPTSLASGWKRATVHAFVLDDWSQRAQRGNRSQFRLRFPNELSANQTADSLSYYSGNTVLTTCPRFGRGVTGNSCRPYLVVEYEYP
ncbi:MAG: Ig-like domain-containing protein [Myxococcaceae bacterium]|jgi:methionine-rich copper-binding protein CopC|nr:Ig-like domain-containing protein [Myxococcaceae bacterium]